MYVRCDGEDITVWRSSAGSAPRREVKNTQSRRDRRAMNGLLCRCGEIRATLHPMSCAAEAVTNFPDQAADGSYMYDGLAKRRLRLVPTVLRGNAYGRRLCVDAICVPTEDRGNEWILGSSG